ncbi:MAG: M23 family metallopeptidase [Bacilli bacterium]|nr:M23 family metallopeptidase [Bacilli bacterium]
MIGQGITNGYGVKGSLWSRGYHTGVDYGGGTDGMTIYPIGSGTVHCVSCMGSSFGNHVVIDHGNGYYSLYAHMRSTPKVSKGQKVNIATKLGYVGSTGNVTGPHLHLELWKGIPWSGKDVNPAEYIDSSKSGAGKCFLSSGSTKKEYKYDVRFKYTCTNTARVKAIYISKAGKTKTLTNKLFSSSGSKTFSVKRENNDTNLKITIKYYSAPRKSNKLTTISSTEKIASAANCKFSSIQAENKKISYKLSCTGNPKITKIMYKMGSEVFNAKTTALSGTIATEDAGTNRNTYVVAYYNGKSVKSKIVLSKENPSFKHVNNTDATYCKLNLVENTGSYAMVSNECGKHASPIKVSLVNSAKTKELKVYREGLFEKTNYGYNGKFSFNDLEKGKTYYIRVVYRFKDDGQTKVDVKYIKFKAGVN